MKLINLVMLSILSVSCNSQVKKGDTLKMGDLFAENFDPQIGEYVCSAFEDSKGNLWFGTLEKGIANYDGERLKYFTTADGLASDRVTGIIEDANGMFWLMTGAGLSQYDGEKFTNHLVGDDFASNMISNLFIDSKSNFWIGTWNGVFKFDGEKFHPFPLPFPKVNTKINADTKYWITGIKEDLEGNIWINRDGYGVCKYDGSLFTHLLKKDGLNSNNVTDVEFDNDGSVWIGTRVAEKDNPNPEKRFGKGGVNRLVESEMLSFPEIKGFSDGDVYEIYKAKSGNIWISTTENGVYSFDGNEFKNYKVPISIMGMMDDKKGNLWLCGAGGLYKINQNGEVINVTINGPWD